MVISVGEAMQLMIVAGVSIGIGVLMKWVRTKPVAVAMRQLMSRVDELVLERDRETELRRSAEHHVRALQSALDVKPYPNEYDDMESRAIHAEETLQSLIAELRAIIHEDATTVTTRERLEALLG